VLFDDFGVTASDAPDFVCDAAVGFYEDADCDGWRESPLPQHFYGVFQWAFFVDGA